MQSRLKLCVAIGGFLIVTGLILTGNFFLILSNVIDISIFTDKVVRALLTLMFLAIGVASIIAGIILLLKR
ncbi:MAG: hypothetical protein N3E52_03790 [Candidatus Bathyarchaeota archaeon]|nr:hypothetical protein [Candidatus Bathyarchaeota archaeon]